MIKQINFLSSKEKYTYLAPNYNYLLIENNIKDKINIDEILNLMLKREEYLISENKQDKTESEKLFKTIRYKFFNEELFKTSEIQDLILQIKNHIHYYCKLSNVSVPRKIWIQFWCNILRGKETIQLHQHSDDGASFLSGNLCLETSDSLTNYINPQTYFKKFDVAYSSENKTGNLTIFPSTIPHFTENLKEIKQRITIAFDVMIEQDKRIEIWHKKENDLFKENIIELRY